MGRWNSLYQLVSCCRDVRKNPAALVPSNPESLWHLLTLWRLSGPTQAIQPRGSIILMPFFFNAEIGTWLHTRESKALMLCFQVSSSACESVFHTHSGKNSCQERSWGVSACDRDWIICRVFQAPLVVLQTRDLFLSWSHLDTGYLRSTKVMGHTLCKGQPRYIFSSCCLLAQVKPSKHLLFPGVNYTKMAEDCKRGMMSPGSEDLPLCQQTRSKLSVPVEVSRFHCSVFHLTQHSWWPHSRGLGSTPASPCEGHERCLGQQVLPERALLWRQPG